MTVVRNLLSRSASSVETTACVAQVLLNLSTMRVNQAEMVKEEVIKYIR